MLLIAFCGEVAQVGNSPRCVLTMYLRFMVCPFLLDVIDRFDLDCDLEQPRESARTDNVASAKLSAFAFAKQSPRKR